MPVSWAGLPRLLKHEVNVFGWFRLRDLTPTGFALLREVGIVRRKGSEKCGWLDVAYKAVRVFEGLV